MKPLLTLDGKLSGTSGMTAQPEEKQEEILRGASVMTPQKKFEQMFKHEGKLVKSSLKNT